MATETERLEEALKNAAAAGDTEAAQTLAAELRRLGPAGSQPLLPGTNQETPQGGAGAGDPDPFANIPIEINGTVLSDEMRSSIFLGRAIKDPAERQKVLAVITGRIAKLSGSEESTSMAILNAISTGPFGIGTGIQALGDTLAAGGSLSFSNALEIRRAFNEGFAESSPVATSLTEVAVDIAGGGIVLKGLKAISSASKLGKVTSALTEFKTGGGFSGFLKNSGRASFIGSAAGAASEGGRRGNIVFGGVAGGVAGPAGVVAAKVVGAMATGFVRTLAKITGKTPEEFSFGLIKASKVNRVMAATFLSKPEAKGLLALAKKLKVSPDELAQDFQRHKAVTGKAPSIVELANREAVFELKQLISTSVGASQTARTAAQRALTTRAGEVAKQVKGGKVTTTIQGRTIARNKLADEQFALAREDDIPFTAKQVIELFQNDDLRKAIPRSDLVAIDDLIQRALIKGPNEGIILKGKVVDDIRQALADGIGRGFKTKFTKLHKTLVDIGRKGSVNFANALDEFAGRSANIEGVAAGRGIASAETDIFEQAVKEASGDLPAQAGIRVGARSKVVSKAGERVDSTLKLTRELTEESGLIKRLRTVFSKSEIDRLQELARVQAKSIENIGAAAPGTASASNTGILPLLVNFVVLISPATSAASKTFAGGRAAQMIRSFPGIRVSDRVAKNIARDMFDPKKTETIIKVLRKAGASESQIFKIYAEAAIAGGILPNN